jgi:hypothetical protein
MGTCRPYMSSLKFCNQTKYENKQALYSGDYQALSSKYVRTQYCNMISYKGTAFILLPNIESKKKLLTIGSFVQPTRRPFLSPLCPPPIAQLFSSRLGLHSVITSDRGPQFTSPLSGPPSADYTAKKIRFMYSQNKKLRGLSPNFHIHVSVNDLYTFIPTQPIVGIYKSLTKHEFRNWDRGHAVSFLGIFVLNFRYRYCLCSVQDINHTPTTAPCHTTRSQLDFSYVFTTEGRPAGEGRGSGLVFI